MLYATRFESGSAHNQRVTALRDVAEFTRGELAADPPFRFLRFQRTNNDDKRTRGWYVVDFGHGEIALEKGQVELVLLGFVAALAVTAAMPPETAGAWISRLLQAFEEGCAPRSWTA